MSKDFEEEFQNYLNNLHKDLDNDVDKMEEMMAEFSDTQDQIINWVEEAVLISDISNMQYDLIKTKISNGTLNDLTRDEVVKILGELNKSNKLLTKMIEAMVRLICYGNNQKG